MSLEQAEGGDVVVDVIEEPTAVIDESGYTEAVEESKEGFLNASDVDVIPAAPLPDNASPAPPSQDVSTNNKGLGVGGFFAILIFVSILFYIFRKFRALM